MNRAFKTEFHNGNADGKPIVTMSVKVNNGKKFNNLSIEDKKHLYNCLFCFKKQLEGFMDDVTSKT